MYDPRKHHRQSIRLRGYDYADDGAYFITICVHERRCLFGDIRTGEMIVNDAGRMVADQWLALAERFPRLMLDEFVVMPNHLHGLLGLSGRGEAFLRLPFEREKGEDKLRPYGTENESIGRVVQAFKSLTTNLYITGVRQQGWPQFNKHVWQPNFYDHIPRDQRALDAIREYISTNPQRWDVDAENPGGSGADDVQAFVRSLDVVAEKKGEDKLRPYGGNDNG